MASTTKPRKGSVSAAAGIGGGVAAAVGTQTSSGATATTKVSGGASTSSPENTGAWRPDVDFVSSVGLRITMRKELGVTKGDVLRVPMRFQVPVTDQFERPYQVNWATFDTVSAGQGTRVMGRQLLQLAINTILMDQPAADSSTGAVVWDGVADPQGMLNELRWIMGYEKDSEAQVFRLVVDQPSVWDQPVINMLATIIEVDPIQHDEVGTEYVTITFQQFPEEQLQQKQRPQTKGSANVTVQKGDSLYSIATKTLHAASSWKKIASANGISGVSPNSASELEAWLKKHNKTTLSIPSS